MYSQFFALWFITFWYSRKKRENIKVLQFSLSKHQCSPNKLSTFSGLKMNFILLVVLLMSNFAESLISQRFFKRMVFSATSWPNLVYKMAPIKVSKAFDCVGQCQLDSNLCNIAFFDPVTQECWLATIGSNYGWLASQTQAMGGFADLGGYDRIMFYKCNSWNQLS